MDTDISCSRYRGAARGIALVCKKSRQADQLTITVSGQTKPNKNPRPQSIDFVTGAKAFRKNRLISGLLEGVMSALYVMLGFTLLIITVGVLINWRYHGRAMPFSYVGNVSVGGMTKPQIVALLNNRFEAMKITLVEGGLVRQVPLSKFGIIEKTVALSNQVVPKRISPFSFLDWQRYNVPIVLNDNIIAGYVEQVINPTQTKSTDAQIIVEKNKLAIQPDLVGFRTNPNFIINQIDLALSRAEAPDIAVNVATIKPKIYSSNLTADLSRANQLLQTSIAIKFGYVTIKPTLQQKLSWLQSVQTAGSNDVELSFSEGLVRNYLINQTEKIQQYINGSKNVAINNLDQVASGVITAMESGSTANQQLTLNVADNHTVSSMAAESTVALAN